MFNCPFCGFDYLEQGLQEGRCPSCSGVIEWNQTFSAVPGMVDEGAAGADQPSVPAGSDARPVPPANAPAPGPQDDGGPRPDPPASQDTRAEDRAAAATMDAQHLTAMWAGAFTDSDLPLTTIKSNIGEVGTITNLVVRPRTIRDERDATQAPADYEILEQIGKGGMGVVWGARQASINRNVALKMLKQGAADTGEREKFLAEAVVTGDLDHPNIVPIYDLGSDKQGALFYSMKWVRGTPWMTTLPQQTTAENLEILQKVCDAVAFAHSRDIVHRDIKPENVMLGDFGEVLLMDWGIAIPLSDKTGIKSRTIGGTPAYMAPEMATGPISAIGPCSDIYLLGAVLYEIVTGRAPRGGRDVMACVAAAARNEIRPSQESGELLEIALTAMATKPSDRYATVQDFQAAIRDYQSHSESIVLAARARTEHEQALQTDDYEDYARSVFAYQEALALWSGNVTAREGLKEVRFAYARSAGEKEDYELGLSLLDVDDSAHKQLRHEFEAAMHNRASRAQREQRLKRLAQALVLVLLVGGWIAIVVVLDAWRDAREGETLAKRAQTVAEGARAQADQLRTEAEQQRDTAHENLQRARAAEREALIEQQLAEDARQAALQAQHREEEGAYESAVRLAQTQIERTNFASARTLLSTYQEGGKRSLRHWEWGHLQHLCDLAPATLASGTPDFRGSALETVAVSPDQQWVAAGSADGSIYVWHIQPGTRGWQPPVILEATESPVYALSFAKHGLLASGGGSSAEGVVKIWSLSDSGLELQQDLSSVFAHRDRVTCVAFSRDGEYLLTGSADHSARLKRWRSAEPPQRLLGHFDTIRSVGFSHEPEQAWIVTASEDGTARVWDRSGNESQRFGEHEGPVYTAVFSPDNQWVASGGDHSILIWETEFQAADSARERFVAEIKRRLAGEPIEAALNQEFTGHQAGIRSLRFSKSGALLLSASQDSTVKLWEVDSLQATQREMDLIERLRSRIATTDSSASLLTLRGHGSWVTACAWIGDESHVVSTSYDMTSKLWDLAEYAESNVFRGPERPALSATLSPDGAYVGAAFDDGTARVWSVGGETAIQIPPPEAEVELTEGHRYLASTGIFSSDGTRLYTAAGDNTVRLWDPRRGTQRGVISGTGYRGLLATDPDGQWLLTGSANKTAVLWDSATLSKHVELDHVSQILATLQDQFPQADEEILMQRVPEVTTGCFTPDGELVFTGDTEGGGQLWNVADGTPRQRLLGHTLHLYASAITPDGEYLVTGSADTTAVIWRLDGEPARLGSLPHPGSVTALGLHQAADRTLILTACGVPGDLEGQRRRSVELVVWELESQQKLQQVTLAADRVNSVTFTPDGTSALVVALQGSRSILRRWDLHSSRGDIERQLAPFWQDRARRGSISSAIFAPARMGAMLLTVGGSGARLWDLASGRRVTSFRPHTAVTAIGFSPDGQQVVTGSTDGSAKIWRIAGDQVRAVWRLEGDVAEAPELRGHQGAVNSVAFHPQPGIMNVLTGSDDGTAKVWSLADNELWRVQRTLSSADAAVNRASYSPDGSQVLTVADDGSARVWNLAQPQQPALELHGHQGPVHCGLFSSNGEWIVTGGEDRTVIVFDAVSGTQLAKLEGFTAGIKALSLSSDRQRLLVGDERVVRLWNLKPLQERQMNDAGDGERPAEIVTFEHHRQTITSVTFSRDGRHVLTSALDGSTVLLPGQAIEPSLELSRETIVLDPQANSVHIAANALVRVPSSHDFTGHQMIVTLRAEPGENLADGERLELADGWTGRGSQLSFLEADDGSLDVFYQDRFEPQHVASVRSTALAAEPLAIELTEHATGLALETILRCVRYHRPGTPSEAEKRTILIGLYRPGAAMDSNRVSSASRLLRIRAPSPPAPE